MLTAFCCFLVNLDDGLGGRIGGAGSDLRADDEASIFSASRSRTRAGGSRRVAPKVMYESGSSPESSGGNCLR